MKKLISLALIGVIASAHLFAYSVVIVRGVATSVGGVQTPTAFWKLDEASGNRLDQYASQTLTAQGGAGSAAGMISNALRCSPGSSLYNSGSGRTLP